MKRLLIKEYRESRVPAWTLLALTLLLLLLRDPLSFREDPFSASGWALWPMAVSFLMGLGAYSRELGWGTLPFALSRPIGAWRLAAAKLASGFLVCLAVTLAATLLYLTVMPDVYRPHADAAFLLNGAGALVFMLSFAFLAGFACSVLAPGPGLALAASVAALTAFFYVLARLEGLYRGDAPLYVSLAGMALGTAASVAPVTVLDQRRRLGRWLGFVGGSILIATALALILRPSAPQPPDGYLATASPDRSRVIHAPFFPATGRGHREIWLEDTDDRVRRLDRAEWLAFIGWIPDSESVVYAVQKARGPIRVRTASAATGWAPRTLLDLPPLPSGNADLGGLRVDAVTFSPSGQSVSFTIWEPTPHEGGTLAILDLEHRKARLIPSGMDDIRTWWLDERRLVVLRRGEVRIFTL